MFKLTSFFKFSYLKLFCFGLVETGEGKGSKRGGRDRRDGCVVVLIFSLKNAVSSKIIVILRNLLSSLDVG